MSITRVAPPVDYLRSASRSSLQSFELARLNQRSRYKTSRCHKNVTAHDTFGAGRYPFRPVSATLSMIRRRSTRKIASIGRVLITEPAIIFP